MKNSINSEASQPKKEQPPEAQETGLVQCWLAEFESLQNEKFNYQRMQHNLIWVNVSVLGAILTIYFAYWPDKANMALFLAVPIISSLLGIYWVAQGRQTSQVTHYVRDRIAPALQTLSGDPKVIGWEDYVRAEIGNMLKRTKLPQVLAPVLIPRAVGGLIFVISCLVGLALSGKELILTEQWQIKALWALGCILTLFLIVIGYWLGQYWAGDRNV